MTARQISFLPTLKIRTALDHGGDIGKGRRKLARPFDPKRPLHVVLRSTRARGQWSLLRPRHADHVESVIKKTAETYGIKVYRFVNVGNHLHLIIQTRKKTQLQAFLRVASGQIAMLITKARKGSAVGRFWDKLAYSRVISWGREFEALLKYLVANLFEAQGFWNRKQDPQLKIMWISMDEAGIGPPIRGVRS